MPNINFSDFVNGLVVDSLSGPEKLPLVDTVTARHATASLLAAFAIDQLHQASVITTLSDSDEVTIFQSDIEKILTAQNLFNWIVDKLEAIGVESTIVSGDRLLFNDGGVLKQIDIDNVKAFLDTQTTSLGSQINGLSAATLSDSDQYVLAQGSTALKTTFTAIAARVHTQFLTYLTSLPAVVTLADADTFYADDGGVPSKVTATALADYVKTKVGGEILSSAWDTYSPLGGVAQETDVFLLERTGTGRTATGANIADYVVASQNSATSAVSAASGDAFLIFRSGLLNKLDIGLVATHVLSSGWSASSGNPVVTADKILIGRGSTTFTVTVDQLSTFVLNGVQANVLNLTGLSSASLVSGSLFLVGDGASPRKATLTELETKLWADYQVYVSGLTAHTTLADANTFYVIDGSTPKRITAANIAVYVEAKLWDKSAASPAVQTGDEFWMRRGSTTYKTTVTALGNFIAGVTATNIDLDPLPAATLSDNDLLLVDEGASNSKVTVSNFRTYMWSQFAIYVTNLSDGGSAAGTDTIYALNTGNPIRLTFNQLWTTRFLLDAKAIKLDEFSAPDDNTNLNASTTAHGLLRKLNDNTREFLRGDGSWATYASMTAAPVAATGTVHTDAAVLSGSNTTFITSDNSARGVKLPTGAIGDIMEVINTSGTDARLYPATSGTINGLGVNAAVVIPASRGVRCFCSAADTWRVFEMTALAATA